MKGLVGVNAEVVAAKEKLRSAILDERSNISSSALAILKQGTSYAELTSKMKLATAESEKAKAAALASSEAIKKAADDAKKKNDELSGLVLAAAKLDFGREWVMKFRHLEEALKTSGGQALLAVGAFAAVAAAIIAVGAAATYAAVSLAEWIIRGADANRVLQLQREQWTGSAANATALGHQIDALARRVPMARDELQKLAGSMWEGMNNSRIAGQGYIDTLNAVAQATSYSTKAADKFREIVERAKNTGRVVINPIELQGMGLKIQDIGAQLAKSMKIGAAQANAALTTTGVEVNTFAAALRKAAEVRFGDVNTRMLLGLEVIAVKLGESLKSLTKDVNIEPLLQSISDLADLFSQSTFEGQTLKAIVTSLGDVLGTSFRGVMPSIREVFDQIELAIIRVMIKMFEFRNWAVKHLEAIEVAAGILAVTFGLIAVSVGLVVGASVVMFALLAAPILVLGAAVYGVYKGFVWLWNAAKGIKWSDIGMGIVDGIMSGFKAALAGLKAAVFGLADVIKEAFKLALGIASPSKVFEEYGKQTTEGYNRGLGAGGDSTQDAVDKMAPSAPEKKRSASGAGTGGTVIHVHLHNATKEGVEATHAPRFLADLTKAIEDALVNAGVSPQTAPAS